MTEIPNLDYIHQLSGGDNAFEEKLIAIIKAELPLEIAEYRQNLTEHSYLKTAENVHKLKHKISILGLEKSYQLAIDFEEQLKESDTALQQSFEKVLDAMVTFVAKL